jgi:ketosteroid isomerase-like protein
MLPENPGAEMPTSRPCEPPSAAEAAASVRALNEAYIDAARTHDAAWFDAHMSEDVIVILGGGQRFAKANFLTAVRSDRRAFRSLTVRDVTVRVFGTTVQVDADAPWVLEDGGEGASRYIDTYAWLDCRWQVVSAQITLLPASEQS